MSRPLFDVKLFSTADFVCSRSGRARDRFGGLLSSVFWAASCAAFSKNAHIVQPWPYLESDCRARFLLDAPLDNLIPSGIFAHQNSARRFTVQNCYES